ncbi:MAG: hypothetical protein GKS06_15850 [Acidobacteria bacterium]|nr:hypothetical protein [Acidobacteriota bacterium]
MKATIRRFAPATFGLVVGLAAAFAIGGMPNAAGAQSTVLPAANTAMADDHEVTAKLSAAGWNRGVANTTASTLVGTDPAMAVCVHFVNGETDLQVTVRGGSQSGGIRGGSDGFFRADGASKIDISAAADGAEFRWRVEPAPNCGRLWQE